MTASSGGRLRPDFQAAHSNAAELEASAKIVEKAAQGQSLELRFSKQEPREKQVRTETGNRNRTAGAVHRQARATCLKNYVIETQHSFLQCLDELKGKADMEDGCMIFQFCASRMSPCEFATAVFFSCLALFGSSFVCFHCSSTWSALTNFFYLLGA